MAERALARGLIEAITHGDVTFSVAGPADEPDVRRLLRENPLGGRFEISLEREPDAHQQYSKQQQGIADGG